MALPAVPREVVLEAMKTFDDTLRNAVEWSAWEQAQSQRYALVNEGRRYPPKKVLSLATGVPVSAFSGGTETNGYLSRLGFAIETLARDVVRAPIEKVLSEYPSARDHDRFGAQSPMYVLFQDMQGKFQGLEEVQSHPRIRVKASVGQGVWAKVPWIAFLDERETDSTQHGLYVVLLFCQDGSGAYITLNQGVTEVTRRLGDVGGRQELRRRAQDFRAQVEGVDLGALGFALDDGIDLKADPGLGRNYEASTIAYKYYARNAVPSDEDVAADLDALLRAYDFCLERRGTPPMPTNTVHLLLKWTRERDVDTIGRHKAIADTHGFVWWGKFGNPIGTRRLSQLKEQLERGATTYVFLSGNHTLWRTTLQGITTQAGEIDLDAHPSYYSTDGCSFFVKVSDFQPVDREWLNKNAVSDLEGRPPGAIEDLLASQANPGYLRLTEGASEGADSGELCLLGTASDAPSYYDSAKKMIAEKGAIASWWSFKINPAARARLKLPFYLYINAGNNRITFRCRVDEYQAAPDDGEIETPWPDITPSEDVGKTRQSDAWSEVFRTWFRIGAVELLTPTLTRDDFLPAEGLSSRNSLLHRRTFGYAYRGTVPKVVNPLLETLLDEELLRQMVDALTGDSPQIVLAGPPGTSKTWVAVRIAEYVAGARERVTLVQFHPSFSYEAFIEGLKPSATETGNVIFKNEPGIVLQVVKAMAMAGHIGEGAPTYVIVIDEMNRANLARVFGELMFLFEYRNHKMNLQYSAGFSLPPNLRFIGTMNTADRSIRSIDLALRRRFDVFELPPDTDVLERYFETRELEIANLSEGLRKLNADLEEKIDRHHTIGHAFFMRDGLTRRQLEAIWARKIRPIVEEYFFDQPDIAGEFTLEKYWPAGATNASL